MTVAPRRPSRRPRSASSVRLPAGVPRGAAVAVLLVAALLTAFTACEDDATTLPAPTAADVVSPLPPGEDGTVDRVVDGDTVVVDGRTVRLIGVDTPETVKPNSPVECYGPEASQATKALLPPGERVRLVADAERTDRYKRDLRYVYRLSDGLFVQSYLVREGFGRTLVVRPNVARRDLLARLEKEAREAGRGLWGAC